MREEDKVAVNLSGTSPSLFAIVRVLPSLVFAVENRVPGLTDSVGSRQGVPPIICSRFIMKWNQLGLSVSG